MVHLSVDARSAAAWSLVQQAQVMNALLAASRLARRASTVTGLAPPA
jgi:hypothetical protein